jgi:hypothetical protein
LTLAALKWRDVTWRDVLWVRTVHFWLSDGYTCSTRSARTESWVCTVRLKSLRVCSPGLRSQLVPMSRNTAQPRFRSRQTPAEDVSSAFF